MSYIGKSPSIGNFQKCDSISVVNGQATYALTVGGSAVFPESSNHVLCSLNGILQASTDSFTISSSNIVFASNLSTGDVIDFVMILGNVLDLGVPSDNTVSASKLTNDIISGQTELATEPADTDEFLVSDAGTIKRIDYSLIKGGGITEADAFRLSASINGSGATFITSNIERIDESSFSKIGTGLTESSGVFSFPSTGIYLVQASFNWYSNVNAYTRGYIYVTTNNSSYDSVAQATEYIQAGELCNGYTFAFVDVTDVSQVKVKFGFNGGDASSGVLGDTAETETGFNFIRLGDT
mgnify:CR=1 FL=1